MLDDPDRSVALDAIGTLRMIGPDANAARSELQRIASANADSEKSQAARLALSRIDAPLVPPKVNIGQRIPWLLKARSETTRMCSQMALQDREHRRSPSMRREGH
jgi:hypothetical protein